MYIYTSDIPPLRGACYAGTRLKVSENVAVCNRGFLKHIQVSICMI